MVTVKKTFEDMVESSRSLHAAIRPYTVRSYEGIAENPLHPNQARKVVGLALIGALAAWEEFLEAVFVRYLAGACSPSGYVPSLRLGQADSIKHAYEVLTGDSRYNPEKKVLSWTSLPAVIKSVELLFCEGHPFRVPLEEWEQSLQDAFIIRNRVAHSSRKARNDFKRVALQHLGRSENGSLSQGYSAGDLLLESSVRGFRSLGKQDDYFSAYMTMLLDLARKIAP